MKNQYNREQIQCPSCGHWNNSDEAICGGCGRILQIREKPPVDYRRLVPKIILAVVFLAGVSFGGYLKFTISDAEKKIAAQNYEAAANELMKISFYKKADEMLQLPELEENCAFVAYARAQKLYKKEDYVGAMTKLASIQTYEDSDELLRRYLGEFLEGSWTEVESREFGIFFSTFSVSALSMEFWDIDGNDYDEIIINDMSFLLGTDLAIELWFDTDNGFASYYDLTNIEENYLDINGYRFERN